LIGANGEKDNKSVIELILKGLEKNTNEYDKVMDRPGHDMRYAIDSTKLQRELNWSPQYTDFESGLNDTIEWYKNNQDWLKPQKQTTEDKYKSQGQ